MEAVPVAGKPATVAEARNEIGSSFWFSIPQKTFAGVDSTQAQKYCAARQADRLALMVT